MDNALNYQKKVVADIKIVVACLMTLKPKVNWQKSCNSIGVKSLCAIQITHALTWVFWGVSLVVATTPAVWLLIGLFACQMTQLVFLSVAYCCFNHFDEGGETRRRAVDAIRVLLICVTVESTIMVFLSVPIMQMSSAERVVVAIYLATVATTILLSLSAAVCMRRGKEEDEDDAEAEDRTAAEKADLGEIGWQQTDPKTDETADDNGDV